MTEPNSPSPAGAMPPVHPFELRITIGANTWEYAQQAAQEIADYIGERKPEHTQLSSGGWNGSYSVTCAQREISAEDFRKELQAWHETR